MTGNCNSLQHAALKFWRLVRLLATRLLLAQRRRNGHALVYCLRRKERRRECAKRARHASNNVKRQFGVAGTGCCVITLCASYEGATTEAELHRGTRVPVTRFRLALGPEVRTCAWQRTHAASMHTPLTARRNTTRFFVLGSSTRASAVNPTSAVATTTTTTTTESRRLFFASGRLL
jgi:hypothetical protein